MAAITNLFYYLLARGPSFAVSRLFLRPLFGVIANTRFYSIIWSFTSTLFLNVGFFPTIMILINFRRYFYGRINLNTLSNFIFNINPIMSNVYESTIRGELITLARQNLINAVGSRRLINFIVFNAFLLYINSIFKFFSNIIIYSFFGVFGLFFIATTNKVKHIAKLALDFKLLFLSYFNIPFLNNLNFNLDSKKHWYDNFFNYFNFNKLNPVKDIHVHKITQNIDVGYIKSDKYKNFMSELFKYNNDTYTEKYIFDKVINSEPVNYILHCDLCYYENYFASDFIFNLFNQFNLFI